MLSYNLTLEYKTVLVTGAAGFIGSNLVKKLLTQFKSINIVGIDSLTDYYDVKIKKDRLEEIKQSLSNICNQEIHIDMDGFEFEYYKDDRGRSWKFIKGSIADKEIITKIFRENNISVVVNLAAQAGVRYSITNPDSYIESNIIGFYNILEACRHSQIEHLVYASSSSVYGSNSQVPYSIEDKVDTPVSLYAATKKSNELMAHAYSKLYSMPTTGLRFFTVYGPAGRPDMAYFSFTDKLVKGDKIKIFNYGNCKRDFTYIDDIIEGIIRVMQHSPEKKIGNDGLPIPPYKIYNIGNSHPVNLMDFVSTLFNNLVKAEVLSSDFVLNDHLEFLPMQPGDVIETYADTKSLEMDLGFKPSTSLSDGLMFFAQWYKKYIHECKS